MVSIWNNLFRSIIDELAQIKSNGIFFKEDKN